MSFLRIISIDKPKGWTSFDVVRFVKRQFQEKKVGHLGTLDPMATGVLPVFLGQATRLIPLFNNVDKTYRAVCKFGESTDTYDAEGTVTQTLDPSFLNPQEVTKAVYSFIGQQEQQTPAFSAAKVNGVPAYKLARQGLEVPVKIRTVTFHELEVESVELPFAQFRVHCSKGTYIRTLVNDLGLLLKAGAHLTSLERLACGAWFHSDNSVTIEKLKQMEGDSDVPWISPLKLLDHLYTVSATSQILTALKYGRRVEVPEPLDTVQNNEMSAENEFSAESKQIQTKVLTSDDNLVAIGYLMWENDVCYFQPSKVFI
jgi:tRNA pseudouridine55 synthase